jgi:RNA polymerase sigma factor (TIGR02999 family)
LDKPVERPGIDAPGSGEDLDRVIAVALPELRRRARSLMRGEKAGHLLQPTALVSEAFVRLFRGKSIPWDDPAALIIAASNAMGQALVDHARWQRRQKRMGHLAVSLPDEIVGDPVDELRLLSARKALEALRRVNERQAVIVQMRFFGGLEIAEIAAVLGCSDRTVKREWALARDWMHVFLTGGASRDAGPEE